MSSGIILEIRPGIGGEEATLFAADLLRMYQKFIQQQGWQMSLLILNQTGLGGIKEAVLEIEGTDVFEKLKFESGVHRVQRIPKTEKSDRIHTSTATVAVLPKINKIQLNINPDELKIDVARASGPGGQNVNKVETAIKITHLPTGLTASCQRERSQARNKTKALELLRTKLFELKQRKQSEKIDKERKNQIGWGERSEKIRTYNFPQNRITDHRARKSWHDLENILNGNLKPIIKFFQKHSPKTEK